MDGDARWSRRQQGRCSKIAWDRERVLSERLRTDANEQLNREKPITGLTPDDEIACWGASILPNDKGCWPMRGKSIEQVLAVCPIGKTCQVAGVLKNLTHGLYCWTEVNSVIAK